MGEVRGPYDYAEWLTMKMLKFDSRPHLAKKNKEHGGKYQYNIDMENTLLKNYYLKNEEIAA